MKMKIAAISDMHGILDGLNFKDAEIAIIAGDFAKMTGFSKWHLYDQKKWIDKKFIPFLQLYKNTQFVIVPGNHDLCLDQNKLRPHYDINWHIDWPENVHLLQDSMIILNGLKIYGTPWVPIISYSWAFEAEHDVLTQKFSRIPDNIDILITHTPPRISDCNIDYSIQTNNGPFGSSELTQAIFEKKPRYLFCGHIHSGDHECIKFQNTYLYNVSYVDENYEMAYKTKFIDFEI